LQICVSLLPFANDGMKFQAVIVLHFLLIFIYLFLLSTILIT
jgi:hypothetical protein